MNPVERHRKKMHEREVKKNKETKKQMREVAVLYKDTTKLEDKIERYRGIKRKLTEEENGRLRGFEAELDEARKRQREAGVEINREHGIEGRAVGYDPLSGDKEHNAIVEYDSSSDNEVIDEEVLGKEVALDQDEYEKEEKRTVANEETEDVGVGVVVVVGTGAGAESSILTLICHDQHILRQ
ncbi:hypothetical protein LPJ72_001235 [Coemansia sp. Benny D160-2]|nr:hypothetical protein LPJ72_001235 [Coemansia sp. Benny D160-2]